MFLRRMDLKCYQIQKNAYHHRSQAYIQSGNNHS